MHAGYDLEAEAILLAESDGTREEVADEIARMIEVMRASGATDIRVLGERGRAAALLVGAQGRVSRRGPHLARLLLHRRLDPARRARARAASAPSEMSREVRPALRQRLPRGRRQPAPAHPLRRQHPRRARDAPRRSPPSSSSCASRWAAPSPASTAWASRRSTRCAAQFRPAELAQFHAVKAAFDPDGPAQSRQDGADAAPLRRVRRDAREGRRAAASRPAALLMAPSRSRRARRSLALRAIRPPLDVIADDEGLKPFETDAFIAHRETPMLAVLPDSRGAGARGRARLPRASACRWSRAARAPASPAARSRAATACCWCSRACARVLARRSARRAPPPSSRACATSHVSEVAAPHGLFYAPDPSSQSICSIGGNVAENAGGVHCLKYGLTTHNVLAVRAIDADGERARARAAARSTRPATTCWRSSPAARATSA